ncbi:hypothetical protein [Azospirillum sp. B510]|uniref:hypothetical protein n=1 Tax=Azospirillum sp. (strain B510) TaxID=137722 RepID=UPI0011D12040|nr:hypothetical protein [Azospirillum sp. B510]
MVGKTRINKSRIKHKKPFIFLYMRPNGLSPRIGCGGYCRRIMNGAADFLRGAKDKRSTMDADTALSIMESLDQAEDLLRRMHLRDGYACGDVLARNRELLDAARHRLDQIHRLREMGTFDACAAAAAA